MRRPQVLVGFVAVSLGMASANALMRSPGLYSVLPQPKVASAHTNRLPQSCYRMPCISLTFDDGPDASITPAVLDVLKKYRVKATFYVVGRRIAGNEHIVKRAFDEGHEIGNHSWDHPDLSTLSPEAVNSQLQQTQEAITSAGVPAPQTLRPPYGAVDPMVAAHNDLAIVRWNVDPEDWRNRDPAALTQHMVSQARPGAIMLLHDLYPETVAALGPTVQALKPHYQFVTASQLLNLSPGDQGQFFGKDR